MVKPSPELVAVSRRWYAAIRNRDTRAIANLMSDQGHLRFVGTAADEVWIGADVKQAVGDFFGQIPELISSDEVLAEAFENGNTGWSCFVHHNRFASIPDEVRIVRNTLVFALEDGNWKMVQRHGSTPMDNTEFMGTEQIGITALLEAVREDYQQDHKEGLSSILFTDIVNSSRIADAMGDRLWSQTIEAHFALMQKVVSRTDGQLVKSLGDGTLSRFASARQALRAAQTIQREMAQDQEGPALALRIGVHTGDVVQSNDDFFGTVVNKAARLMAHAGPGEIAVSQATCALVGEGEEFSFSAPEALHLKGFDGVEMMQRLIWRS